MNLKNGIESMIDNSKWQYVPFKFDQEKYPEATKHNMGLYSLKNGHMITDKNEEYKLKYGFDPDFDQGFVTAENKDFIADEQDKGNIYGGRLYKTFDEAYNSLMKPLYFIRKTTPNKEYPEEDIDANTYNEARELRNKLQSAQKGKDYELQIRPAWRK